MLHQKLKSLFAIIMPVGRSASNTADAVPPQTAAGNNKKTARLLYHRDIKRLPDTYANDHHDWWIN